MKTLPLLLILLTGSLLGAAATAPPAGPGTLAGDSATYQLTVVFGTIAKRSGMLYIGVANDEASFDGNSYRKTRVEVPATGDVRVRFEGLPAGRYAVRVYQDLNDNQKLDFKGQMPTEPFGFSNAKVLTGPPTFGPCAFELNSSKVITIDLTGL